MTDTHDALEASFAAQDIDLAPVQRPLLGGARAPAGAAFEGFLRSGASIEMKAFTGVTGDAGGYAIPREINGEIDATLQAISPIRSVANVVKVGSAGYRKLVTTGGAASGWAAEVDPRPGTATPSFVEIVPPMGELYANPSASQAMLDDAAFDVEAWLADEIATEFAQAEGAAFVNGSGVARPRGWRSRRATWSS
jgi:HK97 family phage major capsid protein